jgi:hypothetical protein
MSPDESFLVDLLRALEASGLEAIIVGNTAAALQGAPVMTQDVDLLVRDTPNNATKIERFCAALGAAAPAPVGELTRAKTILGAALPVDLLFDELPGQLTFQTIRSRSQQIAVGPAIATVASLDDVIRSKEAADRPKDRAVLPILRDTLRVKQALATSDRE